MAAADGVFTETAGKNRSEQAQAGGRCFHEPRYPLRHHWLYRYGGQTSEQGNKKRRQFEAAVSSLLRNNHRVRSSQKATALAAATFRESTPWAMGMRTV